MARAVSVLLVPEPPKPESSQVENGICPDLHTPKLMVRQRHGKLFNKLDLSGLELWAPDLFDPPASSLLSTMMCSHYTWQNWVALTLQSIP